MLVEPPTQLERPSTSHEETRSLLPPQPNSSRNPRLTPLQPIPAEMLRMQLIYATPRRQKPAPVQQKSQQRVDRGRAAALAATYLPVSKTEMKQIEKMRTPRAPKLEVAGSSSKDNESELTEVAPALGRGSTARREAAAIAKCF